MTVLRLAAGIHLLHHLLTHPSSSFLLSHSEHRRPRDSPSPQAAPRAHFLPHRCPPPRRRKLLQALRVRRLGGPSPISYKSRQGMHIYIAFPPLPSVLPPSLHSTPLPPSLLPLGPQLGLPSGRRPALHLFGSTRACRGQPCGRRR